MDSQSVYLEKDDPRASSAASGVLALSTVPLFLFSYDSGSVLGMIAPALVLLLTLFVRSRTRREPPCLSLDEDTVQVWNNRDFRGVSQPAIALIIGVEGVAFFMFWEESLREGVLALCIVSAVIAACLVRKSPNTRIPRPEIRGMKMVPNHLEISLTAGDVIRVALPSYRIIQETRALFSPYLSSESDPNAASLS